MSRIAHKRKSPVSATGPDFEWRFGGFEPESWVGLRSEKAMATNGSRATAAVLPFLGTRTTAPSLAMRLVERVRSILAARRGRRVLQELLAGDDRMLADIGLTRGDVEGMLAGR